MIFSSESYFLNTLMISFISVKGSDFVNKYFGNDTNTISSIVNTPTNVKIYNAYFLGGLEILHEEFVEQCHDDDDYLKQMYGYVNRFYNEQDGDAIREGISKYLD